MTKKNKENPNSSTETKIKCAALGVGSKDNAAYKSKDFNRSA